MRIVFMGSTEIGYRCLEKLLQMNENVVAIYALPPQINISYSDKPVVLVTHKSFNELANRHQIPLIEMTKKMKDYYDFIKQVKPDFILVIGWYYMIPRLIRDIAPLGCAGIHASLLPKYSGGAPVNWAIINGEKKTGVTLFYLEDGVDNGDIIAQREIPIIFHDTCATVYQKAIEASLKIIEEQIPLIKKGRINRTKQNEADRTIYPQRKPEDGLIDWNKSSMEIYNWVRAQTMPYPGAFTYYKEEKIIIWDIRVFDFIPNNGKPGEVLTILDQPPNRGILIATRDTKSLLITKIGTKSERGMEGLEFAYKKNIQKGDIFGY